MKKSIAALLSLALVWVCLFTAQAEKTVVLTLTGDVTLGGEPRVSERETSFNSYCSKYGYDYFFAKVKQLFETDDLTLINFEGTLTDSGASEDTSKTYRFIAPTDYVQILTGASVEGASIANNHIMDFGEQGYNSTRRTLTAQNIGYAINQQVFIWEKDGIKIAFFALMASSYQYHKEWCQKKMASLKSKENVNAIVFAFHVGKEYATNHEAATEKMASWAISAGADLVVMHHPHVLQGEDIINNRSVFYSLGNFCFGGNAAIRALETIVLRVTFTFSDEGVYQGQQVQIYPAHVSGSETENDYQPCLVTGEDAEAVLALIQADTDFPLGEFDAETGCVTQAYLPAE